MRTWLQRAARLAAGAVVVGACESDRAVGPTAEHPSRSLAAAPTAALSFPPGYWYPKAPVPQRLYGAASAVVNGILYTMGGSVMDATGAYSPAPTFAYDPASNSWTAYKGIPNARWSGARAAAINGLIYVTGEIASGYIDVFDPSTHRWTTLKSGTPTVRSHPAVAALNGRLYVMGGTDATGAPLATVESYDPAADKWSRRASMPTPRTMAAAAVVNGLIYVVGGGNGQDVPGFVAATHVDVYDPATNSWVTRPSTIPTPNALIVADVIGSRIHVAGGYPNPGVLQVYDPAFDGWSGGPRVPTSRGSGATGATLNGALYVVGGWDDLPGDWTAAVEAYKPCTSLWPRC